jgi:hypothetical protein
MSSKRARDEMSCCRIPHANRAIVRGRCDTLSIWRECNRSDLVVMCVNRHFQCWPIGQLPAFKRQCVGRSVKVLVKDTRRAWSERERRNIDMRSALCHWHSEVPHKRGCIIHQFQQILYPCLQYLFQFYANHYISHRIMRYTYLPLQPYQQR